MTSPARVMLATRNIQHRIGYTQGYLVIESDDGKEGDYTHWLPASLEISKTSRYLGKPIVICPNINSSKIGGPGYMTPLQLSELQNVYGWEIVNHGKYHAGLGEHPVIANVEAGQKRIDIKGALMLKNYDDTGYTYRIFEGEIEENVQISSIYGDDPYGDGYIMVSENLQNSYTTNARIGLTEQSIRAELMNCVSDLESWGIDVKNHVYTYHAGAEFFPNSFARGIIAELFNSARGRSGTYNAKGDDIYQLNSLLFTYDKNLIDTALDYTQQNNLVMIFYGHSETSVIHMEALKYLMEGALTRGIRITTRQKAIEYLTS